MEMMNLDNFGNPFMAFQQKFDDSAEEDEIEDDDELEGFEFEDEEGGYELDDDYDEGEMVDVKPPVGVNLGDEGELIKGMLEIIGYLWVISYI